MRKSWLLCVLLGTLSWGQAAPGTPPPAPQTQAPPVMVKPQAQPAPGAVKPQAPAAQADTSASVPDNAAVITVKGVCPAQPKTTAAKAGTTSKPATTAKTPAADCKTIVTKAKFELLVKSIPNVPPAQVPQLKKNIENALPRLIAMSAEAKKQGLDKKPEFTVQLWVHTMQILAGQLQAKIKDEADNVPDKEIADYYKQNPEAFEHYSLERLYVPRTKPVQAEAKGDMDKQEKLTEEQQKAKQTEEKAKQEENEQAMAKLAEDLRARAAAGEDFTALQKEAFETAGMKNSPPAVSMPSVRRGGLVAAHASVFELKPGEVSQVINDANGHYIYKVKDKDELPLDQVKDEIRRNLQSQRLHDAMDRINNSFQVENNEAYFGPAGPAGPPGVMGGRVPMPPRPQMAPPPAPQPPAQSGSGPGGIGKTAPPPVQTPPQAQPQTPAPAQPPAQPPATKPN